MQDIRAERCTRISLDGSLLAESLLRSTPISRIMFTCDRAIVFIISPGRLSTIAAELAARRADAPQQARVDDAARMRIIGFRRARISKMILPKCLRFQQSCQHAALIYAAEKRPPMPLSLPLLVALSEELQKLVFKIKAAPILLI